MLGGEKGHMRYNFFKKGKGQKNITIIAMVFSIVYSVALIASACNTEIKTKEEKTQSKGINMEYEDKLFDQSLVHRIDIKIKENDWENLKSNAFQKTYHDCSLEIDGEIYNHVGIRTKGNSTLVQSVARGWDRYSLKLSFGEFNSSQRYYGLDNLSLYNNACDSSYLRDMLCFDMMNKMGVPTPLCSYSEIYLNGEYMGLYIAMESIDESFALRNYGYDYGQFYSPEQFDVSKILTGTASNEVKLNLDAFASEDGSVEITELLDIPNEAVALQYLGSSTDLYQDIWNNAVFKIGRNDKERLINSLKNISQGTEIDYSVDMEELAAYFAVNTFVLNTDCYTTQMAHNYYLYEKDGVLSMIPWDYDQSLGTTGAVGDAGDMTAFINIGIDTPVIGTTLEERPILDCLLENQKGYEMYHEALEKLLENYIDNGYLDEFINRNGNMILPYVERDPINKGSSEKFQAALKSVREFCVLRGENIQGQLKGNIPAKTEEQQSSKESLVDASSYSNPDSGSFIKMVMPEDSGLALEDVLKNIEEQIDLISILKIIPIDNIKGFVKTGISEKDSSSKLTNSQMDVDMDSVKNILFSGVMGDVKNIVALGVAIFTLIIALIWISHYKNSLEPRAIGSREKG